MFRGTSFSVVKLWELYTVLNLKRNFLYESIDLSVYSALEVSVTIMVACLPPLRKKFDKLLQKMLGLNLAGPGATNMSLPSFATNIIYRGSNEPRTGNAVFGDSETDEGVLAGEERKHAQIVKTTRISVSNDDIHAEFGSDGQQPQTGRLCIDEKSQGGEEV
jgi:hypothetical protein